MSKVYPKSRSLEEILRPTSIAVLHVRKLDPFLKKLSISFPDEEKSIPDFTYATNCFTVLKILHNDNAWELASEDTIEVLPANFRSNLNLHKNYHLKGLRKSFYRYYYEGSVALDETEEAIIFVIPNWENEMLEYSINGAYHDSNDLDKIKQILADRV